MCAKPSVDLKQPRVDVVILLRLFLALADFPSFSLPAPARVGRVKKVLLARATMAHCLLGSCTVCLHEDVTCASLTGAEASYKI